MAIHYRIEYWEGGEGSQGAPFWLVQGSDGLLQRMEGQVPEGVMSLLMEAPRIPVHRAELLADRYPDDKAQQIGFLSPAATGSGQYTDLGKMGGGNSV